MGNCCSNESDLAPVSDSLFVNKQHDIKIIANESFLENDDSVPVTFPPAQESDPFSDNNLNDIELNQYAASLPKEEEDENPKKD